MQKGVEVAIHRITRQLHHPVANQWRDRDHHAAMPVRFPHLDRRSHRGLGHVGDQQIKHLAHFHMAHKNLPRLVDPVADRVGVVGMGIVNFRLWPASLDCPAKAFAVRLVVDERGHV